MQQTHNDYLERRDDETRDYYTQNHTRDEVSPANHAESSHLNSLCFYDDQAAETGNEDGFNAEDSFRSHESSKLPSTSSQVPEKLPMQITEVLSPESIKFELFKVAESSEPNCQTVKHNAEFVPTREVIVDMFSSYKPVSNSSYRQNTYFSEDSIKQIIVSRNFPKSRLVQLLASECSSPSKVVVVNAFDSYDYLESKYTDEEMHSFNQQTVGRR